MKGKQKSNTAAQGAQSIQVQTSKDTNRTQFHHEYVAWCQRWGVAENDPEVLQYLGNGAIEQSL